MGPAGPARRPAAAVDASTTTGGGRRRVVNRRISAWWYGVGLSVAIVSVLAGGFAVGTSVRPAVVATVDAVEGYVAFAPGRHISVDMVTGQTRYLFASADPGLVGRRGWWCDARPAPGSVAVPRTFRAGPGRTASFTLPSGDWWLIGKVETFGDGQVVVTCEADVRQPEIANLRFAVTPNIDGATYRTSLHGAAVGLVFMLFGLMVSGLAAGVVLVVRMSRPTVRPTGSR